jgi:hypothetical protein
LITISSSPFLTWLMREHFGNNLSASQVRISQRVNQNSGQARKWRANFL